MDTYFCLGPYLLLIRKWHAHAFKKLLIQDIYKVLLCNFLMSIPNLIMYAQYAQLYIDYLCACGLHAESKFYTTDPGVERARSQV